MCPIIVITCHHDAAIGPVVEAVRSVVPLASIHLMEERPLPAPASSEAPVDDALAQRIAELIRPREGQDARRDVLVSIRDRSGTFRPRRNPRAGPDHQFRAASAGLSRILRREFPLDASPLDRLAVRQRIFDPDGSYLETRYEPTKLGLRVLEILAAEQALA